MNIINNNKATAINIVQNMGYNLNKENSVYVRKHNNAYYGSIRKSKTHIAWYILLDDPENKELIIFYIPKNSELKLTTHAPNVFEFFIEFGDENYIDKLSGESFEMFFIEKIKYERINI